MLADAFDLYANAYERSLLLRDFYGRETALFSGPLPASGSEEDKERAKKGLIGVLEAPGMDEEKRRRVLGAVKGNLITMYARELLSSVVAYNRLYRFNNPDKGSITHSIVHRALWEYLTVLNDASVSVSDESEREKMRREIFERFLVPFFLTITFSHHLLVVKKFLPKWSIQKMVAAPCVSSLRREVQRYVNHGS